MKIQAIIIIEMMGKPAGHLKETLEKYVDRIGIEKGIKILNRKVNKPKQLKDSELFSSFAEVELELENIQRLVFVVFTFMPSHIEIISPEEIRMRNFELNALCNELTRRLLDYDAIAKNVMLEKRALENQLRMQGITPTIQEILPEKETKARIKKKKKKKR